MTSPFQYDLYTRDRAFISLSARHPPAGFPLDRVKERIKATLDCLPTSHINLFGPNGNVELRDIRRRGESRGGGGHDSSIPAIRLSYKCFDNAYNNGRLSYTLLHEMGHIVDKSINPTCMNVLKTDFPRGFLAMISRYHGGETTGFSEHYADIYADYFYNEIGGINYSVNRRDDLNIRNFATSKCGGNCPQCNRWLTRYTENIVDLPRGNELSTLRYDALFRSAPFSGIERGRVYTHTTSSLDSIIHEILNENPRFRRKHEGQINRDQETALPVGRKPGVTGL